MNDERPVTIYALCDETGIRYIGQTRQPLKVRTWQHRFDLTTGGAAKIAWIKALRAAGQKPRVEVLEVVAPADALEAERRHIALAREHGCDLVNVRPGGESGRPLGEAREVVRVAVRMPPEIHAALLDMSAAHRRSMNAQIVDCLQYHVKLGRARRARAARAAAAPPPKPEEESAP